MARAAWLVGIALWLSGCVNASVQTRMANGVANHNDAIAAVTPEMIKDCEKRLHFIPLGQIFSTTWRYTEPLRPDPRLACLNGTSTTDGAKNAYYSAKVDLVAGSDLRGPTALYWCRFITDPLTKQTYLKHFEIGLKFANAFADKAQKCGLSTKPL